MNQGSENEDAGKGATDGILSEGELLGLSPKQRRVFDLVRDHPGCSIQAIADRIECDHSTAQYHLRKLEGQGVIERERDGRVVRHYIQNGRDDLVARLHPILEDEDKRSVLEYLHPEPEPTLTVNEIATELDLHHTSVLRVLERMEELDVVHLERRRFRYVIELREDLGDLLDPP